MKESNLDPKAVKRMRNKVLKQHPKAKPFKTNDGYFIVEGDATIGGEHFIPGQPTEDAAWFWAGESIKIARNIKRTHPLKAEIFGGDTEQKYDRMYRRMLRGLENNE